MITRLTIPLYQDERAALQKLAESERRAMREQAALIIRRALERRGMLERRDARIHNPQPPQATGERT